VKVSAPRKFSGTAVRSSAGDARLFCGGIIEPVRLAESCLGGDGSLPEGNRTDFMGGLRFSGETAPLSAGASQLFAGHRHFRIRINPDAFF